MKFSDTPGAPAVPRKLSGIKAVLLDMDGTMVDSVPDFHIALNRVRADFQLPPIDVSPIRHFVGRGSEYLVRSALEVDMEPESIDRLMFQAMTSFNKHYLAINGRHSVVYPGVAEGLAALKAKNLKIACVTNKPAIFTEPLLANMELYHFFDRIYSAESFPLKKPHPMPVLMACQQFGFSPEEVLFIGDSISDAMAAQTAGCPLYIVPYGYNHGQPPEKIQSDGVISSILQASELIF